MKLAGKKDRIFIYPNQNCFKTAHYIIKNLIIELKKMRIIEKIEELTLKDISCDESSRNPAKQKRKKKDESFKL